MSTVQQPHKVSSRSWTLPELVDGGFFLLGTGLVLWLGWLLLTTGLSLSWSAVAYLVAFWLLTAYVGLPRLQQVLTKIYVPDYFIGRTLTVSGLLGDPVNVALDGTADQVHAAMTAAGWHRADEVTLRSSWGIIVSAVLRRSYPTAPVSPLMLFGAREAFAYEQEVGGDAARRHHVRFWPTPHDWVMPGGLRVGWLAAGTFDRRVGLSLFTLQVTHKIEADVDAERDHVVATVQQAVPAARVRVLENFVAAFNARNGGGDVVHTDGSLVVVDLTDVETTPPEPLAAATRRRHPFSGLHLPPPALLVAGVISVVKAVEGAVALGPLALPSIVVILLWVGTLARVGPARILLMTVCAAEAVGQLVRVAADAGEATVPRLVYAGLSVLVLLVVSSDESRRWVSTSSRR